MNMKTIKSPWWFNLIVGGIIFCMLYIGISFGVIKYVEKYHPESMPINYCTKTCTFHNQTYYDTENAENSAVVGALSTLNTGCHQCLCEGDKGEIYTYCL